MMLIDSDATHGKLNKSRGRISLREIGELAWIQDSSVMKCSFMHRRLEEMPRLSILNNRRRS